MTRSAPSGPTLSFVVPTHNRYDSLLRLLGVLRAQATHPDGLTSDLFDVVVVADGCEDDTVRQLQRTIDGSEWPFKLTVLEHVPAQGAGIARNAGAAMAQGEVLVFVDDDIEPFPTMAAAHAATHAEAMAEGHALLLVGAPTPVRSPRASLHEIAAWGWWEQQFEQMSSPGHRFTYDEIFTGVLSMPASLFRAVGGFDASLGDCHEDSELGLRLFRAGARTAFSRAAGGIHHEMRDMPRLLPRKFAEGRADVRIAQRWPELIPYLRIAEPPPSAYSLMGLVRGAAFRAPLLAQRATHAALPLLSLLDRLRWRASWRLLHGGVLMQSYWRGVASEVARPEGLRDVVDAAHEGWSAWLRGTRHLTIDLLDGLEHAERLLDRERPDAISVRLGDEVVGDVSHLPIAERLHGGHLRRLLASTLAYPLRVALALRSARLPLQSTPPVGQATDDRSHTLRAARVTPRDVATLPLHISVIIPAWNAEGTLARTLDSLLAQTMPRWEAIVVDDGSSDGTGALAAAYAERDARVRVVRQANGGLSAARNAGIALASHEWLHFLDADDWMAPNAFARLTEALEQDSTLDAVHCGWARVAADGAIIAESRCWEEGDLFPQFAVRCAIAVHACLVRRSAVQQAGGFDPGYRIAQDWVLWQRMARRGARFGSVPDTLAFYAFQADSLSNDPIPLLHEALSIIALGHGPDASIQDAVHAEGAPAHERATAELHYVCWVAGMQIARGEDAVPLLEMVPRPIALPAPVWIAESLVRAVPHSLGVAPTAWSAWWPALLPAMERFIAALEVHTGVEGFGHAVRVAMERMVATYEARPAITLGVHHVVQCEITAPVTDLAIPNGCERLAVHVLVRGERLGMVELPAIDGMVPGSVLRDAIADAYAWPILGRFFESSLYRSFEYRNDDAGCSVWRDGVQLADGLPLGERARMDALHDEAGWALFVEEVWAPDDAGSALADSVDDSIRGAAEDAADSPTHNQEWTEVEVSRALHDLRLEPGPTVVALSVGGVAMASIPIADGASFVDASSLRARMSEAVGFELCRTAVREGLVGVPWDDEGRLWQRLSYAAARRVHDSRTFAAIPNDQLSMAPGWSRQIALADPSGTARYVLARRASPLTIGSAARTSALPASEVQRVASVEGDEGMPGIVAEKDGPTLRGLYLPSLLWRRRTPMHTRERARTPIALVASGAIDATSHGDDRDGDERVPSRALALQRLPILMYHHVASDGAPERTRWRITPRAFEAHMAALSARGYRTVTLQDWAHAMETHVPLRGRPVVITFDDGYDDLADVAWPILRRFGFGAIAFLVTGSVGRYNTWDVGCESESLMDWPVLRRLRDEGLAFGAHSVTHRRMTSLSPDEMLAEALGARQALQRQLGASVNAFAYPFGDKDPVVRQMMGAAGFEFGLSVRMGHASYRSPWLSLPRIEITGNDDVASFIRKLEP